MVYYTFKVNLEVNQMGKKIINLGLDIGNYDVKTVNTSTPSGFNVFTTKPYGVSEYLLYEKQLISGCLNISVNVTVYHQ